MIALDEWVSDGKAPPASRTPRLKDGTLVVPDKIAFPAIPGVAVARRVSEFGVLKDWIKPEMDMPKPYPKGELCDRFGTYVPFSATRAEREAKGDPRLSLEERYGDHAGYVRWVEQAVKTLVAERLLHPEDGERFTARAGSAEAAKRFAR